MSHESKLKRARAYLSKRGIAATAPDSKLVYRDHAGMVKPRPEWLKQEEPRVVVENVTRMKVKA